MLVKCILPEVIPVGKELEVLGFYMAKMVKKSYPYVHVTLTKESSTSDAVTVQVRVTRIDLPHSSQLINMYEAVGTIDLGKDFDFAVLPIVSGDGSLNISHFEVSVFRGNGYPELMLTW